MLSKYLHIVNVITGMFIDPPKINMHREPVQVNLSKKERRGLTYEQQQELRRYKSWLYKAR